MAGYCIGLVTIWYDHLPPFYMFQGWHLVQNISLFTLFNLHVVVTRNSCLIVGINKVISCSAGLAINTLWCCSHTHSTADFLLNSCLFYNSTADFLLSSCLFDNSLEMLSSELTQELRPSRVFEVIQYSQHTNTRHSRHGPKL